MGKVSASKGVKAYLLSKCGETIYHSYCYIHSSYDGLEAANSVSKTEFHNSLSSRQRM